MNEALKKLIDTKIAVINIYIKRDGFDEAATTRPYRELYGIKQACQALGIPMNYIQAENGLLELEA